MNLVKLSIQKEAELLSRKRRYSYNGFEFTDFQCTLYEMFVEAIRENRRLIFPSRPIPRQSGKSLVLKKLSSEYGLLVIRGGDIVRYDREGNVNRIRGMMLRGLDIGYILIDEPTTLYQLEQSGALEFTCLGFGSFEVMGQPYRSRRDIESVQRQVENLIREGQLYEYHRTNQNTGDQELYHRELSTAWRWDLN